MSENTSNTELNCLSDEELMLSYRDGVVAAFDVLYARHKGGLYRYFLRQLNNRPEIANELFQDVWMKLINARVNYQSKAKFATYLYHIAHNRLIDYWRSEKQVDQLSDAADTIESDDSGPQDILQNTQQRQQLKQAIAELPEEQRSALLLKEEASLSLLEIASITGVNRETVKSRLRYAIKRLQGVLHPLRSIT